METGKMHSLIESVRAISEARTIVLKGLKAFAKDESMLDDLENDLQNIGLKPKKDYVLNIKKGTLEVAYLDKQSKHIDNIKRIYRLKENVNEQQLHEATAKLMAQRAITDIFIQSKDIANTFEQFSMKLSTAMQEHVAEFIAEYLQEHIDDVDDLKLVMDYMLENPEAVEKTITKQFRYDTISGAINIAKGLKEIMPDVVEDIADDIQSDAKFKKYADDAKDLGGAVTGWVKGLF